MLVHPTTSVCPPLSCLPPYLIVPTHFQVLKRHQAASINLFLFQDRNSGRSISTTHYWCTICALSPPLRHELRTPNHAPLGPSMSPLPPRLLPQWRLPLFLTGTLSQLPEETTESSIVRVVGGTGLAAATAAHRTLPACTILSFAAVKVP